MSKRVSARRGASKSCTCEECTQSTASPTGPPASSDRPGSISREAGGVRDLQHQSGSPPPPGLRRQAAGGASIPPPGRKRWL